MDHYAYNAPDEFRPRRWPDLIKVASRPYMGITAYVAGRPHLVIAFDGHEYTLEDTAGETIQLSDFLWDDDNLSEENALVAASRIEGSPFEIGMEVDGRVIGKLSYDDESGEWSVESDSDEPIDLLSLVEQLEAQGWEVEETVEVEGGGPIHRLLEDRVASDCDCDECDSYCDCDCHFLDGEDEDEDGFDTEAAALPEHDDLIVCPECSSHTCRPLQLNKDGESTFGCRNCGNEFGQQVRVVGAFDDEHLPPQLHDDRDPHGLHPQQRGDDVPFAPPAHPGDPVPERWWENPDIADWQHGLCDTYAKALIDTCPNLRMGVGGRSWNDEYGGGWSADHFFAHDDQYAYDSLGRHPLPYHGIENQFDHVELDQNPDDWFDGYGENADEGDYARALHVIPKQHPWLLQHQAASDPITDSMLGISDQLAEQRREQEQVERGGWMQALPGERVPDAPVSTPPSGDKAVDLATSVLSDPQSILSDPQQAALALEELARAVIDQAPMDDSGQEDDSQEVDDEHDDTNEQDDDREARVASFDKTTDTNGNPLREGWYYAMSSPKYSIPDHIHVVQITPDLLIATTHEGSVTLRIKSSDLSSESYSFEPLLVENADKKIESHFMTTARRKFSPSQQRAFIEEEGKARNSDKLNLDGTHYGEVDDEDGELDVFFLW